MGHLCSCFLQPNCESSSFWKSKSFSNSWKVYQKSWKVTLMQYFKTLLSIKFHVLIIFRSLKSVCIRSFSGPYSVWMRENSDLKKHWIRTFFLQYKSPQPKFFWGHTLEELFIIAEEKIFLSSIYWNTHCILDETLCMLVYIQATVWNSCF